MTDTHSIAAHHTPPKAPRDIMQIVAEIEAWCDEHFVKKAPFTLPDNFKDFIVKIAYPLAIIGAILMGIALVGAAVAILAYLGLSLVSMPMAGAEGIRSISPIGLVLAGLQIFVTLLSVKLYFKALPGLKTRTREAWRLTYYGYLLGAVSSLVSRHSIGGAVGQILPTLILTAIGLYIWFQVKDRYTH